MDQLICFWKFGPQCPMSPLLPPRKDPLLEYFDDYRPSSNTHPHKQHLYGLLATTNAHQPQLKFARLNLSIDSSILSVDCVEWLNVLQQVVQQLFAQLLSFLCHNTSRNSCFFSASGCRFFAIHFESGFPFYYCDWLSRRDLEVLATAGCPVVGREMLATGFPNDWLDQTMSYQLIQTTSFAMHPRLVDYTSLLLCLKCTVAACWSFLEEVPAGFFIARPSAESLARRQNAVVSTYSNDIVLLSLTSKDLD
ncbi:hypothetical protein F511_16665 [Dorcoceras hygrometricum]|uniref:Uncharacterized protein n=1 Tax=Dorcoceras hygrometricum TaxID=472368 RepID=A0A2Z7CQ04_9LAMI|nr:hypothetical protein F511_16665 [Dorcoceras hygrometricum]